MEELLVSSVCSAQTGSRQQSKSLHKSKYYCWAHLQSAQSEQFAGSNQGNLDAVRVLAAVVEWNFLRKGKSKDVIRAIHCTNLRVLFGFFWVFPFYGVCFSVCA